MNKDRSKAAVPFAGAFGIVDFTLFDCINSGLYSASHQSILLRAGWKPILRKLSLLLSSP